MTSAFEPRAWSDLYLMVGGEAAALTGLIFVAASLHLRAVLRNPWHRGVVAPGHNLTKAGMGEAPSGTRPGSKRVQYT